MTDTVNPSANTDTSPITTTNDNTPKISVFDVIDGGLANVLPSPAPDLTIEFDKWTAAGKRLCDFLVKYPNLSTAEMKHITSQTDIKADKLKVIRNFTKRFGNYSGKTSKLILIVFNHIGYTQSYSGIPLKDGVYIDDSGRIFTIQKPEKVSKMIHIILRDHGFNIDSYIVKAVVENEIDYQKSLRRKAIIDAIQYDDNKREKEWYEFVNAFFDMTKHSPEYVIGVLKKFMHQVKVKAEYKQVNFHLMPIIFGITGTGKSYFINHYLLSAIGELVKNTNFTRMTDERAAGDWDYLVQFLDECQNATRTDVDAIKNKITSPTIDYRPMGTNEDRSARNNSTMIGASNADALYELIRDPTSNRRFAPLYFRNKRPADGFELSFNPDDLWKSIDVAYDPYFEFEEELIEMQKQQQYFSNVKTWFDIVSDDYNFDKVLVNEAALMYVQWCRDHNEKSQTVNYFKKDIKNILNNHPKYTWTNPGNKPTIRLRKNTVIAE